MHVDIADIKSVKGASINFELSEQIEFPKTQLGELKFCKPVSLKGTISNINNKFIFKGHLNTVISLNCSRCNKLIERIIDLPIEEIFAENDDSCEGEAWTFSGNIIELDPSIVSNVILNIPMKVLCKQDCKGLCPKCGQDLNASSCNCDFNEKDPRFEKLNLLVFDEEV